MESGVGVDVYECVVCLGCEMCRTVCLHVFMHACASMSEIVCQCGGVFPAVTQSAAVACSVP